MRCAECVWLDLSTKLNRRWAAIGYAVCGMGRKPAQDGGKYLQQWPIHNPHKCPDGIELTGEERKERLAKLQFFRDFLESQRGGKRR